MEQQSIIKTDIMPSGEIRHVCVYITEGRLKTFIMNERVVNAYKTEDGVWLVNSTPRMDNGRIGGRELGVIEFFQDMEGDGYGVMADEANLNLFKNSLLEYVINRQVEEVRHRKRELRRQRAILSKLNEEKLVLENA